MTQDEKQQIAKAFAQHRVMQVGSEYVGVDMTLVEDITFAQALEVLDFAEQYNKNSAG